MYVEMLFFLSCYLNVKLNIFKKKQILLEILIFYGYVYFFFIMIFDVYFKMIY